MFILTVTSSFLCCPSILLSPSTQSASHEPFILIFVYLDASSFSFAWSINKDRWLVIDFCKLNFLSVFIHLFFFFLYQCVFVSLDLGIARCLYIRDLQFLFEQFQLPSFHFTWVAFKKNISCPFFFPSDMCQKMETDLLICLCLLHFFDIWAYFFSFFLSCSF